MRIAVIAPTQIPARRANTLQVMKMTQAMTQLGHTVRLAAPSSTPPGASSKHGDQISSTSNWEYLAHHYGLKHSFPVDMLYSHTRMRSYDYAWRALRWSESWRAELIYTRLPQAAAFASLRGAATLLEVHDLPSGHMGPWLFRLFLKGKGARKLVVITKALAADLSQQYRIPDDPRFTVIAADGVDLERFENMPEPVQARQALQAESAGSNPLKKIIPERFTIGYSGHLYPGRGREMLLELAKRLPENTWLVVGGEAKDTSAFQAEIQIQKADNIILTGFVPNAELPRYQAACDVLLMPYQQKIEASSGGDISRYLSPLKLFEYLACQRPIISSDLPVLREVLNENNCIFAPIGDLLAWEKAILSLAGDPSLRIRLANHARKDAERYTWESRARRILEGLE